MAVQPQQADRAKVWEPNDCATFQLQYENLEIGLYVCSVRLTTKMLKTGLCTSVAVLLLSVAKGQSDLLG